MPKDEQSETVENIVKKLSDEELDKIAGGNEDEGVIVMTCQPKCSKKNGGCYDCHFS